MKFWYEYLYKKYLLKYGALKVWFQPCPNFLPTNTLKLYSCRLTISVSFQGLPLYSFKTNTIHIFKLEIKIITFLILTIFACE